MTSAPTDRELLSAYVDDELPPELRAELEARIAASTELQADLERLRELKRSLARLRPETAAGASTRRRSFGDAGPRGRARRVAAIAAAAMALFLVLALRDDAALDAHPALSLHEGFSDQSYDVADRLDAAPLGVRATGADPIGPEDAPDLAGSRLVLVATVRERREDGLFSARHYRGANGCRLTFVSIVGGGATPALAGMDRRMLSARWSAGAIEHFVFADGMDPGRFAAIVDFIRAGTTAYRDSPALEVAMARATASARPCA